MVLELFISLLEGNFFVVNRPAVDWLHSSVVSIVASEVEVVCPDLSEKCDIVEGDVLHFF